MGLELERLEWPGIVRIRTAGFITTNQNARGMNRIDYVKVFVVEGWTRVKLERIRAVARDFGLPLALGSQEQARGSVPKVVLRGRMKSHATSSCISSLPPPSHWIPPVRDIEKLVRKRRQHLKIFQIISWNARNEFRVVVINPQSLCTRNRSSRIAATRR